MTTKYFDIDIPAIQVPLPLLTELRDLITSHEELFTYILVHGSVSTGEIVPYSDFDGLLIVKDKYTGSKQLKAFLRASMRRIYRFDPLQHHGWFVIAESQLADYDELYLPVEVLRHSKSIYPDNPIRLPVVVNHPVDYRPSFDRMYAALQRRVGMKWYPKNIYQLKSFLSEIMLLPSLFYAAKYNEAIFKKYSFEKIRPLFNEEEWHVMAVASAIREGWCYELNSFQRYVLHRPGKFLRKWAVRYVAPKIPDEVEQRIGNDFYNSLGMLLSRMKDNLNK